MSIIAVVLIVTYLVSTTILVLAGLLWKISRRFRESLVGEPSSRD